MQNTPRENARNDQPEQAEGNLDADREYRSRTHSYLKDNDVEQDARRAAEALEGDEGGDLEAARRSTKERGRDA